MPAKSRKNKQAQEEIRLRVVDYLELKQGIQKQASQIFAISERAVNKIWNKYKATGRASLLSKKRGVVAGTRKISGEQAAELRGLIKDKLPDQLKLPFGLWTREAVQQLIVKKYHVELSYKQVGRYLKEWGYAPQKPIRKAFEQKPAQVQSWLSEEFPSLKKKALKDKAVIYFGDETGMRSDHQTGRSYAPKGYTPVIKSTGQRFGINMISAMSNKGHLEFMLLDGRFNAHVFHTFLEQLIKYKRQKIYFVTDSHPAHRANKLAQWLEHNSQRIEVVFLPYYSPELNPVQYVNQDLKATMGKKRPINKEQMKNNAEAFMKNRKRDQRQVQKYFHHKHVRYAA